MKNISRTIRHPLHVNQKLRVYQPLTYVYMYFTKESWLIWETVESMAW